MFLQRYHGGSGDVSALGPTPDLWKIELNVLRLLQMTPQDLALPC